MNRTYAKSLALFERAASVVPGGIYGHTSPAATLPGCSPYYAERARGARYWDVDGNEFLDLLCGYGPIILGHQHPEVEAAADEQRARGSTLNHPGPVMVELAERLVDLVDFAGWAVFGKNGSDMTTWATQVAREFTGRKKILKARGAYHGSHSWCTPGHGGLIEEDYAHIHAFPWNDLDAFNDLAKRHQGEVAAVVMTAFHHPAFADSELPAPGFHQGIQETCRREGIVFILDDVRSGFRLHPGGSHRFFGFEPDLICFSKAIANGHPLSAALGRDELKRAASRVFLTGSFWGSAAPMAAAMATLQILVRDGGVARLAAVGAQLRAGMHALATRYGFPIRYTGPDAMPFMTFAEETNFYRSQAFCREAVRLGAYLHPHHNWFLSTAHGEKEIQETLEIAEAAFAVVREEFNVPCGTSSSSAPAIRSCVG